MLFSLREGEAKVPAAGRNGRSLLFQDDPEFPGVGLRVFPFRHFFKRAAIGFPPPGFPTLRKAAQKVLRSVFHFVDREQSRHFDRLLSFPLTKFLPARINMKQNRCRRSICFIYKDLRLSGHGGWETECPIFSIILRTPPRSDRPSGPDSPTTRIGIRPRHSFLAGRKRPVLAPREIWYLHRL
jgi:hypothetical protein